MNKSHLLDFENLVAVFCSRLMQCQRSLWKHNASNWIAVLIVSLSLIVFSVLFVWLGFGLLVACVRVVYVIGHTCGFPDHEVVNGALLHHGSMCCSRGPLMCMCASAPCLRMSSGNCWDVLLFFYPIRGFTFWFSPACEIWGLRQDVAADLPPRPWKYSRLSYGTIPGELLEM